MSELTTVYVVLLDTVKVPVGVFTDFDVAREHARHCLETRRPDVLVTEKDTGCFTYPDSVAGKVYPAFVDTLIINDTYRIDDTVKRNIEFAKDKAVRS